MKEKKGTFINIFSQGDNSGKNHILLRNPRFKQLLEKKSKLKSVWVNEWKNADHQYFTVSPPPPPPCCLPI